LDLKSKGVLNPGKIISKEPAILRMFIFIYLNPVGAQEIQERKTASLSAMT
jgi:hypothetical protein